jgi:hypothetical protein
MSNRAEDPTSILFAGAAETIITPPAGVDLSGYAAREGPSTGVHDDLWCRAVVLGDGVARVALVSLDLLGLDFPLDQAIRRAVTAGTGINREHILLNCSHTHSGPSSATVGLYGLGEPDQQYTDGLPARVADTVALAANCLRPVIGAFGAAPVRIGINRRERTPDGTITIGRNPDGIVDEAVRVLRISDSAGKDAAVLFNHACHGTTLGGTNLLISSEWMGEACERLQARLDAGMIPVFLQGCCGQINPDREGEDRSFREVERLGGMMADAVLTAMAQAEQADLRPLRARLEHIPLPLQDPPDPATAKADLGRAQRELEQAQREQANPYWIRACEGQVEYAKWVLSLAERKARNLTLEFAVEVLAMGDVALVGLSGEVFFDFAEQIAAASPFRHTMVLGYSNGCTGYVPNAEAFAEGGYEPEGSFRYYGTLPLAPNAGEKMAAEAVRLLHSLAR